MLVCKILFSKNHLGRALIGGIKINQRLKRLTMKTLIFSDTHLTNKPDPKRMAFLKKIINEADRVIINGDFWDGVFISFDQFLSSP